MLYLYAAICVIIRFADLFILMWKYSVFLNKIYYYVNFGSIGSEIGQLTQRQLFLANGQTHTHTHTHTHTQTHL